MQNKVEFKKIREFGEIINDSFLFIKQNFKALLKTFVYFCGIFILAGMLASIFQQLDMKNVMFGNPSDTTALANIFSIKYFLAVLMLFFAYAAGTVSILSFIDLYVQKGNVAPGIDEIWSYFKYYFLRVFGSSFIMLLFMMVCFACCLIPGIYVFPAVSLFYPVMIFENGSLSYSFSRSFKLLKDQWWVTAATLFVIWLITYAAMSFISIPALIFGFVSAFSKGTGSLTTFMIIITSIIQYVCQIFQILPIIVGSLCYYNLTERLESTGLFHRIDQFGTQKGDLNTQEEY